PPERANGPRGDRRTRAPHVTDAGGERPGGGGAEDTPADTAVLDARGLREKPGGAGEQHGQPAEGRPAAHDQWSQERRRAPGAEQDRQQETRVAERLEARPPQPGADRAGRALLIARRERCIEGP